MYKVLKYIDDNRNIRRFILYFANILCKIHFCLDVNIFDKDRKYYKYKRYFRFKNLK